MLLNFPEHIANRSDVEGLIHQSVDFVLSCETPNGNYPPVPGECRPQEDELLHWCHGSPGVVYLLVKAYLTWKDNKYLQAAKRCAELTWQRGLLRKGPGICHGVAGKVFGLLVTCLPLSCLEKPITYLGIKKTGSLPSFSLWFSPLTV